MDLSAERDSQDIDKLYDALQEIENKQNKVDISEFYLYADLFREESKRLPMDTIGELSNKFFKRFNMYRPIEVYHNDELLFKVPQLFIPISEVAPEFTPFVDKFQSEGVSDVPKYSAEATAGLLLAILKSQHASKSEFASYGEYIKFVSSEYRNDINHFTQLKNEKVEIEEESSEESGDIDGLSWK